MSVTDVDVRALLQRVESLEARVRALEAGAGLAVTPAAPAPVRAAAVAAAPAEELSEEVLTVIAAAIGAFLGVKARIKQVRMVHSDAWAQQGRASIMASHGFAPRR